MKQRKRPSGPRQLTMALDADVLRTLGAPETAKVVSVLAALLLEQCHVHVLAPSEPLWREARVALHPCHQVLEPEKRYREPMLDRLHAERHGEVRLARARRSPFTLLIAPHPHWRSSPIATIRSRVEK